jgi:hypothetical protein
MPERAAGFLDPERLGEPDAARLGARYDERLDGVLLRVDGRSRSHGVILATRYGGSVKRPPRQRARKRRLGVG